MTDIPAVDLDTLTGERRDLVETLRVHRGFLRQTLQGLDQEQATRRTTVSVLNLAGLVKHVADTEAGWIRFAKLGTEAMAAPEWGDIDWNDPVIQERMAAGDMRHDEFNLVGDETLESVLAHYERVGAETDAFVVDADLDVSYPLPEAPWFEPGASRSVRRVLLHIVAETAQHAGHADILREALDGAKTMG
ncbi:DinB family protein [Actinomycetospora endophytica]|uniref:DinB family protein n=1 Tax=Actinomycetospora endophytica TaxID=2291215 RepID=A0ABS8PCR4_9PSEU|nr:DinB family protein [Actinomycetospora endophytica]MCD2196036.1 DinB family protein [Actinomycetospora endophytica]